LKSGVASMAEAAAAIVQSIVSGIATAGREVHMDVTLGARERQHITPGVEISMTKVTDDVRGMTIAAADR
jgi:hypothetical protein